MPLTTPYAYIDHEKMETNMKAMSERLQAVGIDHWPHIKTHKSVKIAKRQLELGAKGITVAKLSEAEVMAAAGVGPILIAYSIVGDDKLARLQKLAAQHDIRTTVDSLAVAAGVSRVGEALGKKIEVMIEVDTGSHRGGLQPGQDVLTFAQSIRGLPGIDIMGVFAYSGHIYGSKTTDEIKEQAAKEASQLSAASTLLNENGFHISVISGGSTPASFYPEHMRGLTQSRAGNYLFGDRKSKSLGLMVEEECALRIQATVISTPLPGYATIDAGSKTLTSDLAMADGTFGAIVGKPGIELVKLNEEHGYLRFDPERYLFAVGDKVDIIPNHSCVVANLCDTIAVVLDGGTEVTHYPVDARGRNY